jgi:hypothetical protein
VKAVVYLEPELGAYLKMFCRENRQSESSLLNDLVRWLKDEA